MSLEANKSVARRFIEELWNERKVEVADEIVALDCVTHQLRSGADSIAMPRGPEIIKQHVTEWVAGFPDMRFTIVHLLAEGDYVMMQCVGQGTHLGTWLGIAATGKVITIQTQIIQRMSDGRIVEDWVITDFLGVFQQFGLVRPTAELLSMATQNSH
jgi:predicted SnoaL-like aldol condensation-catalyzing enzyme